MILARSSFLCRWKCYVFSFLLILTFLVSWYEIILFSHLKIVFFIPCFLSRFFRFCVPGAFPLPLPRAPAGEALPRHAHRQRLRGLAPQPAIPLLAEQGMLRPTCRGGNQFRRARSDRIARGGQVIGSHRLAWERGCRRAGGANGERSTRLGLVGPKLSAPLQLPGILLLHHHHRCLPTCLAPSHPS